MRTERTEVLVAGAGPVGLWTALLLAKAGVEVTIIDREERTAARSYACALHPPTLALLDRLGLTEPLLARGRKLSSVAFYEGQSRRAELNLAALGGRFPFLLVVPQNELEHALEEQLRQAGVSVHWNHRFDSFQTQPESVEATIEELGGTATGYIVPHWEMVVKQRASLHAEYLLGADGANSRVRHQAGIECAPAGAPLRFAAYEFESEQAAAEEVRVVLDESTTNVLWPLPGNKCRWTFQLVHSEVAREFPEKERRAVHVAQGAVDEKVRQYVQRVAQHRAPWFSTGVKEVSWCTEVAFEPRMARPSGRDRCWLLGDAAHQTGPVGVQSLNAGLAEAEPLAGCLHHILRQQASAEVLQRFEAERQARWQRLLGLTGGLKARPEAQPWVRAHASRLLSCLPGTGADLATLAAQLKLELP